MTSILSLLRFPPPERRDSVRFHIAKNLPYNTRINLTLLLMIVGLGLQIIFMNPAYGAPFLLAGIGLVLVKGYDSRARLITFSPDSDWKNVSIEKIRELEKLRMRNRRWDNDALDISNPLGKLSIVLIGCLALFLSIALGKLANDNTVTVIMVTDTVIILVPLWFTGMRFILKQPNLAVRVDIILRLFEEFRTIKMDNEEFKPALKLVKDKGNKTVPIDARFAVAFSDSPEGFYGLQAQINLNVVQGKSYPYFYCVLAAKPGFGISSFKNSIALPTDIICEYQEDSNAEVLVIRQKTTRTSGYHTKDRRCAEILKTAIEGGRKIN